MQLLSLLLSSIAIVNAYHVCSRHNISFFRFLDLPDDGSLEVGGCRRRNESSCKIFSTRAYLPRHRRLLDLLEFQRSANCDSVFSQAVSHWLLSNYEVKDSAGLPYGAWTDKVSIGKYVRYNSFLAWETFKQNGTVLNINYSSAPMEWPWADSVEKCSNEELRGWNCAFKRVGSANHFETSSLQYRKFDPMRIENISMHEEVFGAVKNKSNHVIQLLLFGKFMSMITEPSSIVQDFILNGLISLNDNVWTSAHHLQSGPLTARKAVIKNHDTAVNTTFSRKVFPSYESLVEALRSGHQLEDQRLFPDIINNDDNDDQDRDNVDDMKGRAGISTDKSMPRRVTTVSMHVRQGDSCDVMLNRTIDVEMEPLVKDGINRPCYSVDVYMKHLHFLRNKYNAVRVLLATDSQEMIDRTLNETQFNWIYIDIDRRKFGDGHYVWVERRPDSDNEFILLSTVADLSLLRHGDIFLGAFSSHYSKIAFFLMVGQRMSIPPFISLDVPLPCTPFDNCTSAFLNEHILTMDWMFLHGAQIDDDFHLPPLKPEFRPLEDASNDNT